MPRHAPPTRQPQVQPALFEGRLGCSIDEAATALGVQRDTIYRFIADGRLTISKLGRRTIVHVPSIQRLLDETIVTPKPRVRRQQAPHAIKLAQTVPAAQSTGTSDRSC